MSEENKRWLISQNALKDWLDSLASMRTLIAPHEVDGVLLYRPIKNNSEIAWGFTRPVMSAKEAFFPPTERLLTIEKIGGQINLNETFPENQQVIFGVRPCDARGVKILDALFLDTNPADPYYARRRENTVLIGLACKEMGPTCFCTSVGGAPDDARDVDIMLYETGDEYLVEAVTEKGRFIIPGGEWKGTNSSHQPTKVSGQFPVPGKDAWPGKFNDDYWLRMSERCLSCRLCAYVCPTCRCFAIRDEALPQNGQYERIRCWDSCAGENYRRIAGGHKPRAEKGERLRNRFFCKFFYYPEQYGLGETAACTGCGRCVDVCPVNVDITEVLTDLGRLA
jgi:sulfhydrogenase subunit beta (sulfur reductase)